MNKFKRTLGFILAHPLGKKHVSKSISRFILWQAQSTLYPNKLFIKRFVKPVKFYARKSLTGVTGNIYTGLHEFRDMAFLLHFLRPEDTFFDIGANVGSYTLLASGVCKSKSVTLEPVKSTFDILIKNIELNRLNDLVSTVNAAAGASNGIISFTSSEDTTNHAIAENEQAQKDTISVPVLAIDSFTRNDTAALIKIDVEGFETEVLKGMEMTLNNPALKAIIIELNGSGGRYGYSEEDIHHLLLSKEFRPYIYDPFKRSLSEVVTFGNENTIYCRDLEFVENRLQSAQKIEIMGELI